MNNKNASELNIRINECKNVEREIKRKLFSLVNKILYFAMRL